MKTTFLLISNKINLIFIIIGIGVSVFIALCSAAATYQLNLVSAASSDPFATESKPSCREIERNDELYFGSGKEEWVKECRPEKTENLSDIFG